jgi:predicted ATPase/transcriptional regulator with XRE-family HTH domain
MSTSDSATAFLAIATFGDLLKYLRRRARLTQRELSIAVGYSEAQISRLEQNQRSPDLAAVAALFVPALRLEEEPEVVARLMELAAAVSGKSLPQSGSVTITQAVTHDITAALETPQGLPPNNLPVQLTSFIGREKEITELRQRLTPDPGTAGVEEGDRNYAARLVTLTGPGGTGKTRLSLQVAGELLDAFPDGVWLVELASLADPALVPQTVAVALGLREEVGRPVLDTLIDYVRTRTTLLILDNCEHLVEACARLAETLLRRCPNVYILASSRETMSVLGEMTYHVPPLSFPPLRANVHSLHEYESVRLFVDRAAAALPGFSVTTDNASAITQICHQLQGIPLAIELAAARARVLRVEEVAARLTDAFRLLTGGSRTALPRQQTLRATIDWSYNLLSEAERVILRRLSVFAGGWALDAAEEVGGDHFDVLDALVQLVNKSLVIVERKQGKATRYYLLETVRQYAHEKLIQADEANPIRDRHLAYCLKLAEQAERELTGPSQVAWMNRLEVELDNLRAALEWSLESNVEAGLRLASALVGFWEAYGYISDGDASLSQLLKQQPEVSRRTLAHAKAICAQCLLASYRGDFARAHVLGEEALALHRELGDRRGEAFSLFNLSWALCLQDDYAKGQPLALESLALYRELGDKLGIADVLGALGTFAGNSLHYSEARAYLEEGLAIYRELGHLARVGSRLSELGVLALRMGDFDRARPWLEEGLAIQRSMGERSTTFILLSLGELAFHQGDDEQARAYLEASLSLSRETGQHLFGLWAFVRLGYLALRQGEAARAQALFAESQQQFNAAGSKIGVVFALEGFASLAAMQGQPERAVRLLGWADAAREAIGDFRPPVEQADVDRDLAVIHNLLSDAAFAAAYAEGQAMTMEQAVACALESRTVNRET